LGRQEQDRCRGGERRGVNAQHSTAQ
jgi:hypothetical protein